MAGEGGVWRTISGRKVFIKDGESVSEAMKRSGKFKGSTAIESTPGYMSPEDIRQFNKEKQEKVEIEKKALKEKKEEEKKKKVKEYLEKRKKEKNQYEEEVASMHVEKLSYHVLADYLNKITGINDNEEGAYGLSKDEVIKTLRANMTNKQILRKLGYKVQY